MTTEHHISPFAMRDRPVSANTDFQELRCIVTTKALTRTNPLLWLAPVQEMDFAAIDLRQIAMMIHERVELG